MNFPILSSFSSTSSSSHWPCFKGSNLTVLNPSSSSEVSIRVRPSLGREDMACVKFRIDNRSLKRSLFPAQNVFSTILKFASDERLRRSLVPQLIRMYSVVTA